jgi:hypothetical protein
VSEHIKKKEKNRATVFLFELEKWKKSYLISFTLFMFLTFHIINKRLG